MNNYEQIKERLNQTSKEQMELLGQMILIINEQKDINNQLDELIKQMEER